MADDVQAVTKNLRELIAGNTGSVESIVGNISELTKSLNNVVSDNGASLRQTLANFERLSAQLNSIAGSEKGNVGDIIDNLRAASSSARQALDTFNGILGSNKGQLSENFKGIQQTLADLDKSIQNVEGITKGIQNGNGTIGRLVNDEALANKVDKAVGGATDFISRLTGMKTEVSLEDDYLFGEAASKGYVNLKLIPKADKYYLLQLIDDPRATQSISFVQNNPPSSLQAGSQEITTSSRSFKYSAEFAKIFFDESPVPTTVRLGLIESTVGGGIDVNFWNNHIGLTADLFDFDDYIQPYPRVRTYATLRFLDHLEIRGGGDNLLNAAATRNLAAPLSRGYTLGGRDAFLGGGFYFTDDDLKAVLSVAPKP